MCRGLAVVSVKTTTFFHPKLASLSDGVMECIKELNDKGINATLEVIHRNVQLKNDAISERPDREAVISCLKSLFREKKIQFSPNRGYSLTDSASSSFATCKERQSVPQSPDPDSHAYRVETPKSSVRIASPPASPLMSSPDLSSPESSRIHSHLRTIPCLMHRSHQRYHSLPPRVRLQPETDTNCQSNGVSLTPAPTPPVVHHADTRNQCTIHRRDQRYSTLPAKARLSQEYNERHVRVTTTATTGRSRDKEKTPSPVKSAYHFSHLTK